MKAWRVKERRRDGDLIYPDSFSAPTLEEEKLEEGDWYVYQYELKKKLGVIYQFQATISWGITEEEMEKSLWMEEYLSDDYWANCFTACFHEDKKLKFS